MQRPRTPGKRRWLKKRAASRKKERSDSTPVRALLEEGEGYELWESERELFEGLW